MPKRNKYDWDRRLEEVKETLDRAVKADYEFNAETPKFNRRMYELYVKVARNLVKEEYKHGGSAGHYGEEKYPNRTEFLFSHEKIVIKRSPGDKKKPTIKYEIGDFQPPTGSKHFDIFGKPISKEAKDWLKGERRLSLGRSDLKVHWRLKLWYLTRKKLILNTLCC